MEELLKIENLNKKYPSFSLKNVSFSIKPGEIMGFIGRNGAGKTTTLKAIMNLIHYESGDIYAFGDKVIDNELEIKQRIGFSLSEINYYPNRTIKQLVSVISKCYKNFDINRFNQMAKMFDLKLDKKIEQLSSGMKVKYSLAVALSHNAELLILDEPTSGLDPVSRDEILDIFRDIVKDKKRAILFSTHITSDLDKCASNITYINNGSIIYSGEKDEFLNSYYFVIDESNNKNLLDNYIYYKQVNGHIEGLINIDQKDLFQSNGVIIKKPDLEEIMICLERSKNHESFNF